MKTLNPTSDFNVVPTIDADHVGEFEVQAYIYSSLRSSGFDVRGEVKWSNRKLRQTCRFDLVIYESGKAVEIIEVKAAPVTHKNGLESNRQCKRYRLFGIPVTFIYGMREADEFLSLKGLW